MQKVKSVRLTNQNNPAPLWKRFLAYLIDIFIVNLVVTLPFRSYLRKFEDSFDILLGTKNPELIMISFFVIGGILLYFVILEFKIRQTLGKIVMNIYVVSTPNKEITLSQIILRNLTKPFPIVLLVDAAYMFFKRTNQRLFEVFSRTAVVENRMIVK